MATLSIPKIEAKTNHLRVSWQDSPSIQRFLDVIAEIIATEYIQTAKQNPDVFLSGGALK